MIPLLHTLRQHLTKTPQVLWLAVLLFISSMALRVPFLDWIPWGFHWDEASYAYNAFSLMQTGMDEWGQSWPMFLKAYGDFKPALLSYLMIPFFQVFGVTEFAARLPGVILASLGISSFFVFLRHRHGTWLGLTAAFFLMIAPWHMHYSRIAFDPMVSLSFMLLGLAAVTQIQHRSWRLTGVALLVLSMYTYNAARLFVPLILGMHELLFAQAYNWKQYIKQQRVFLLAATVGILVILGSTFLTNAGDRARKVFFWDKTQATTQVEESIYRSVVTDLPAIRVFHNKPVYVANELASNYMSHFSPTFLLPGASQTAAFVFPRYGYLLYIFVPLILLGIIDTQRSKTWWFFLFWLLTAPLPSSLTAGAPNGNRALILLPALVYFAAQGASYLVRLVRNYTSKPVSLGVAALLSILVLYNASLFLRDFYLYFPEASERYWHQFYGQAARDIWENRDQYNQIYMSDGDTQTYIFFAWYNKIDPTIIQAQADNRTTDTNRGVQSLDNIYFGPVKQHFMPCLLNQEKVLVISTEADGEVVSKDVIAPHQKYKRASRYTQDTDIALKVYESNQLTEKQILFTQKFTQDNCAEGIESFIE